MEIKKRFLTESLKHYETIINDIEDGVGETDLQDTLTLSMMPDAEYGDIAGKKLSAPTIKLISIKKERSSYEKLIIKYTEQVCLVGLFMKS